MRAPHFDIWGGFRGFRVVLVYPDTFEEVGTFRTFAEAGKALREAERLSKSLERVP